MAQAVDQRMQDPETATWLRTVLTKVRAILAGSRDPALADDMALSFSSAAEVLLLIERVGGEAADSGTGTD